MAAWLISWLLCNCNCGGASWLDLCCDVVGLAGALSLKSRAFIRWFCIAEGGGKIG